MLSTTRRATNRYTTACCMIAALAASASTARANVTLTDGNSVVTIVTTGASAGVHTWTIDGVNQVGRQWYWYRPTVGAPEVLVNTLPLASEGNLLPGVASVRYTDGTTTFSFTFVLSGGSPGSGTADLSASVSIRRTTGVAGISFFQYADFDLGGTANNDSILLENAATVLQTDGAGSYIMETGDSGGQGPFPTAFEAGIVPVILNKLNDALPTNLNNNASAGPGNVEWAFQWDAVTGTSMNVSSDMNIRLAPPIITCPPDVQLQCGESTDPSHTGSPTVTGGCPNQTITHTDAASSTNCTGRAGIERTWTVTDDCGNTQSCTQHITFVDTTPPIIVCPPDAALNCNDSTSPTDTGTATATDNCGTVSVTYVDAPVAAGCAGVPGVDRTWKATDACGNTATCVQHIRFVDTTPPVISCPADKALNCGDPTDPTSTGTATAVDNCGGHATISFRDAATPAGCAGVAGIDRTWSATDACGNAATCVQHITFVDTTAPVITCPEDARLHCGDATDPVQTGTATASDFCGGHVTISYSDAATPAGCAGVAGVDRTWRAVDACGNAATCVQHITFVDTTKPTISCPPDKRLACGDATDPANTGTATAADNCGGNVAVTYTDAATPADCAGLAGVDRTWKAVDACGNSATCVQHITFADTTPPVIVCPADKQLNCGDATDPSNTGSATATDNCGGQVTITYADATTAAGCAGVAGINRTWKAADVCGNVATCVQHITFVDTTPPVITCPSDGQVYCGDPTDPAHTGSATATDDCGGHVTITFSDVTGSAGCTGGGGIERTWKAVDACGNAATCVQHLALIDNTPPAIHCPPDKQLACGDPTDPAHTGTATATDNCSGTVTVTYSDSSGAAGCTGNGGIDRTWKAVDACGNVATCDQHLTLIDTTPPVIACPADTQLNCGDPTDPAHTGSATATDNCGGNVTITFTDAATAPGCSGKPGIERTWKAADACGNAATCVQHIIFVDTTPPVITCPGDQTLQCGDPTDPAHTGTATATDNCGGQVSITYSDASTSCGCAAVGIKRTWKATDACGNSATCVQTIKFVDTTPPVIACPANIARCNDTGQCGAVVAYQCPTATDNCSGPVSVVCSPASGSSFPVGVTHVSVTATDACGNKASCTFDVTISDCEPPTITCPADKQLTCGASANTSNTGVATAVDNCGGAVTITYTDAATPAGCNGKAGIDRTWKACDSKGNCSTCVQHITFVDTTAPVITCPADKQLQCGAASDPSATGTATATDNCGGVVSITSSDSPGSDTGCTGLAGIDRTWTATDACSNSASCMQRIRFADTVPPVITCPADKQLQCGDPTDPTYTGVATATDNCGEPHVSYTDAPAPAGCSGKPGINRTWKAVDDCNNAANCVQHITFVDTTPPVITCPGNITQCNDVNKTYAIVNFTLPTATDNCGGPVTVTAVPPSGSLFNIGTTTVVVTAVDGCGNSTSCTFLVIVNNCSAPKICCPANIIVSHTPGSCCAVVTFSPTASGGTGTLTITSVPPSGTCFPVGTTTVTSTVRDGAGRTASCTFTVTVLGSICGTVWFDSACDGIRDPLDAGLKGVKVQLKNSSGTVIATKYTDANGAYCFDVAVGSYTVVVVPPSGYSNSTSSSCTKTISATSCEATCDFGVCCGSLITGGYTPGFWGNNNGKSVLQAHDPAWRTLMNGPCLRNDNGSRFTVPTGVSFNTAYATFRTWLIGSEAVNMSYKLSQMLAAAKLNVAYKGLDPNAVVGLTSTMAACYGSSTATIGTVISQAEAALCADGYTPAGDPNRAWQECLKNILDAVNNNLLRLARSTPCPFNTPY